MQLAALLASIEASAPARFVATTPSVYPLVSAVHLFGIALVVGSILPVDLRLMRLLGPQFDPVLSSLVRFALTGFVIAATSGLLLASVRVGEYAANTAFRTKLLILAALGANALALRLLYGPRRLRDGVGRPATLIAGATSVALWTAMVLAGRWIAFT